MGFARKTKKDGNLLFREALKVRVDTRRFAIYIEWKNVEQKLLHETRENDAIKLKQNSKAKGEINVL